MILSWNLRTLFTPDVLFKMWVTSTKIKQINCIKSHVHSTLVVFSIEFVHLRRRKRKMISLETGITVRPTFHNGMRHRNDRDICRCKHYKKEHWGFKPYAVGWTKRKKDELLNNILFVNAQSRFMNAFLATVLQQFLTSK